jgi:23S rRNA (cytosine1962-C5)-methyltransferase
VRRALALRDRLFDVPYYRLIHAEADGMPGLVVDRYGDALVVQLNMAGMALLEAPLLAALQDVLAPRAIILRNDSPARQQEGLEQEVRTACGEISGPFTLIENGATFMADLSAGQKTGWFYDQRPNRAFIARLARDASVLDVYSYTGGFGVLAAKAGAARVVMADRSEPALALAMRAAAANDVTGRCSTERGEAFALLDAHAAAGELFDLVLLDPPAFVKSKKDLAAGSRGYLKLIRAGVRLVAPGGFLFAASCSHNMPADTFAEIVRQALQEAGRRGRIIHSCGAGPDHPVHPSLPESAYLKGLTLALD